MKVAKEALSTAGGIRRLQDETNTEASSESTDAAAASGEPSAELENTSSSESETAAEATEGETATEAEGTTTEGGAAEATDGQ